MHVSLTGKGHPVQVHLGVRALIGVSLFVIAVVPVEGRVAFVLAHFELTKNIIYVYGVHVRYCVLGPAVFHTDF